MPEGIGYGGQQPAQRTPESGVPLMERLKRLLPALMGGRGGDERLPFQVGEEFDPRLPAPSPFDAIRQGLEVTRDLGRPSPEQDAMASIQRMAGGLKKK